MNKTYLSEFITIATVHFLAVASPGPDFAIVVRQSVTYGRRTALLTSLGICIGILLHVTYSLLGIGLIISNSLLAFSVVKYVGALYLAYIGVMAIKVKKANLLNTTEAAKVSKLTDGKAISMGFITNAFNPKVTLFFLAIFTVVVSSTTPIILRVFYGVWVALITFIWFLVVSTFFSQTRIIKIFGYWGIWFERVMGAILIVLAVRLALLSLK